MITIVVTTIQILFICCSHTIEPKENRKIEQIDQQPQQNSTPVLFYNVENLFDTINDPYKNDDDFTPNGKLKWTSKRYFKKIKNISKVLTSCPTLPAIIGLAEIENKYVLEDLFQSEELKNKKYKIITEESADERGIDVALVYDANTFDEVKHQALVVFFIEEPNDKTRDVLYVELKNKQNEILHLFVNHWPSRKAGAEASEQKRLTAAMVVKNKISEIKSTDKNAKIIIMGDFNDNPDDKSIVDVIGAKRDNNKTADLVGLLADEYEGGTGTEIYKGKWNLFDQLIVSNSLVNAKKNLSVNPVSAVILKKDFMLYRDKKSNTYLPSRTYGGDKYFGGFSDHLPVYFMLENL